MADGKYRTNLNPQLIVTKGNGCINDYYKNVNVFITGSTGFVGKALLEKLLRSCKEIDNIYLLMRPKKGINIDDRLTQLLESAIFNKIRDDSKNVFEKIQVIEGDITLPNLGLNEENTNLLIENVNVVFHSAASVRFDETLKSALTINTMGTKRLLELCAKMKKLKGYVHVSTAYSNSFRKNIDEIIYKPEFDPSDLINSIDILPDDAVEAMSKTLIKTHPNNYTFTKALAEYVVKEYSTNLPCCIVRPSIVCATWKDPFPGWVDNIAGITGVMMQVSRGVIKSIVYGDELISDIIPVDIVANTLITAAWFNSINSKKELKIYNCTSGNLNKITWKEVGELTQKYARIYPTKFTVMYPGFSTRTSWLTHWFYAITLHKIPAFLFDIYLLFNQKKPIMSKICDKFEAIAKVGGYFRLNEWYFSTHEFKKLIDAVKLADDGNLFDIDLSQENGLDWNKYFEYYTIGIRLHVMQDDLSTLSKARAKLKKLYWLKKFFNWLSIYLLAKFILRLIINKRRNIGYIKNI